MSGVGRDGGPDTDDLVPVGRDEQAADWCLRLAEDGLTPEEQRALDAWLTEPDNRAALEDAILIWQSVGTTAEKPESIHLRSSALHSFRNANRRRWSRHHKKQRSRWLRLAAMLSLAVVGGILAWLYLPVQVYETGIGERRIVVLVDGSRLSLDAASRVEVRMNSGRRQLRLLSGRAKFDVAKDALRPFSVAVEDKLVVATGTSFSVEKVRQRMRVILYDGRVEVLEHSGSRLLPFGGQLEPLPLLHGQPLLPGRELVVPLVAALAEPDAAGPRDRPATAAQAPAAVLPLPADAVRSLGWETGQLNFSNEPLMLAVERVNRYAPRALVVRDPSIGHLPVNGVFNAGDTAAFVEGVTRLLPVRTVTRESKVELVPR